MKRCFDGFADEGGAIPADNVGSILAMMGMKVKPSAVREIVEEIDEDGSGLLEFGEFCVLAAKFLIEEDGGENGRAAVFDQVCVLALPETKVDQSVSKQCCRQIRFST